MAFIENVYDGDTLLPQLEQTESITGYKPKIGIVDRGYRVRKVINGVKIIIPAKLPPSASNYQNKHFRQAIITRLRRSEADN